MIYPRLRQYEHLSKAGRHLLGAALLLAVGFCMLVVAVVLVVEAAARDELLTGLVGPCLLAGCSLAVLVVAAGRLGRGRGQLRVAERYRIGADSEDMVAAEVSQLCAEGWRLWRSVNWPGRGDVDCALLPPDGSIAFAVECKTRSYEAAHLDRVYAQASWLCKRHGCAGGAVPVLVLARESWVQRWERDVLVVSLDMLLEAIRTVTGMTASRIAVDEVGAGCELEAGRSAAASVDGEQMMIASLAEALGRQKRACELDDALERLLEQLDGEAWYFQRGVRVCGLRVFVLLGPAGVFLLRASSGVWSMEDVTGLGEAGKAIEALLPGYGGPVRCGVVIVGGGGQEPREWATAAGASACVLGEAWFEWWLDRCGDDGFSAGEIVELRARVASLEAQPRRHVLLVRGSG
jgi:hypothetical protein